ncbi:MAG: sensor domain-containing diguanylate cyclase [Coriobacteriia bacterium]|nr:sensor domain-containing diguanylate cyclase [Coriobacteriia bacterium]
MGKTEMASQQSRAGADRLTIAIVGGSLRSASILRLLSEVENIDVAAVACQNVSAPAVRLAEDLGLFVTRDLSEVYQISELDLIIDMSEDSATHAALEAQRPDGVEMIGTNGSELVWDLLVAKKRGEEQEKLFVELQVAYDKIRSHERRLQSSKEALERANEELETRLAEIFFTHEFFKALTSFSTVDDVCSLIVDGANGILGAEVSVVYLFDQDTWTFRLRAAQGRSEEVFEPVVPVTDTVLGAAFRDGALQEPDVPADAPSAAWNRQGGDVRSQAAVPLRTGDHVIGVMVIASAHYRELTPAEMERLQVIGNQSSLSLQNALLHEELERLSVTDRLTELYNHGYFHQRLDEEVGRASRFRHDLALIMIDIDGFKEFNDTYGHPRGDKVLQIVSNVIKDNLRDMDIAARYGGEEFVVVLPETDAEGARAVAERIREGVAACEFVGGEGVPPVHKSVSLGVASFPRHATSPSRLLEAADRAMYAAKREGKNRVSLAKR